MIKIAHNLISGFVAVVTASQRSVLVKSPYVRLSDAMLTDWRNVAKDIKRVQGKLKAEAHDRGQNK